MTLFGSSPSISQRQNPAMNQFLVFSATLALFATVASAADIVDRAEATELRQPDGKIAPRVIRSADGRVTRLFLNKMTLSHEDMRSIARLPDLNLLSLLSAKFSEGDLPHLQECKRLEHLNLTNTEVTDASIDTLLSFRSLKSLCLGNVNITPAAIDRIRQRNRNREQTVRFGYFQRPDPSQSDQRQQ